MPRSLRISSPCLNDMTNQHKDAIDLEHLFQNNREWAASISAKDPGFFEKLAIQQSPEYLWIGCSDSRVPANELLGLLPGDVFVHRNIANVVVHSDLNFLSVLQFAVDVLKVKHVIVCGHYGCSGVHAALTGRRIGLADNWLRHVQDVHQKHERYLGDVLDSKEKQDRLCELNVLEQVVNVCQTTIVQSAWEQKQELTIHGWVYGLQDGLLRDLGMAVSAADELNPLLAGALQRYEGK
jgi:carbonic anhydrase